jgi:hypothetical protein
MRVLQFLGSDGDWYALVHVSEESDVVAPGWQRVDAPEAAATLGRACVGNELEALWQQQHGAFAWTEPPAESKLRDWAIEELTRPTGRLALWRSREALRGGDVPSEGSAPLLSDLAGEPEEVRTFVAFRLLDLAGDPLPDVRYELELADGSMQEGTTDADGFVRHDDIIAGTCTLAFPDLPDKFWQHEHNASE